MHQLIATGDRKSAHTPDERPARKSCSSCIDVLFRSAALEFGSRLIGIVLTGSLDDGTAALWTIKDRRGTTLVQDPAEAEWSSMPESALKNVQVDHVLHVKDMGKMLTLLTTEDIPEGVGNHIRNIMKLETKIAIEGNALKRGVMEMGQISSNTCPECHGVLVRIREGSITRFRCHTGHAFSLQTLLFDVDDAIDDSLWNAIRAIEERALVLREIEHLARHDNRNADARPIRKASGAGRRAGTTHQGVGGEYRPLKHVR